MSTGCWLGIVTAALLLGIWFGSAWTRACAELESVEDEEDE